jgi:50S ribosomal protein L16 3-hydroxylase
VGQHFDWYDVFLVQAHGARRWQLGKWCTADTPLLPDQPLRLLTDLGEVFFDEIVQPGDLLYVPPGLSHHGVAENDCLTASFGFRMPSARQLLERLVDEVLAEPATQIPLREQRTQPVQQTALVPQADLQALSSQLRTLLEDPHWLNQAAMALLSESNFPDTQSSHDPLEAAEWAAALADGVQGLRDPAVRLLYTESGEFWLNGERLPAQPEHHDVLQALANGEILSAAELAVLDAATVSDWLERGLLLLDLAGD